MGTVYDTMIEHAWHTPWIRKNSVNMELSSFRIYSNHSQVCLWKDSHYSSRSTALFFVSVRMYSASLVGSNLHPMPEKDCLRFQVPLPLHDRFWLHMIFQMIHLLSLRLQLLWSLTVCIFQSPLQAKLG